MAKGAIGVDGVALARSDKHICDTSKVARKEVELVVGLYRGSDNDTGGGGGVFILELGRGVPLEIFK